MSLLAYNVDIEFYKKLYGDEDTDIENTLEEFNHVTKEEIEKQCINLSSYVKNIELEIDALKTYEDNIKKKRGDLEKKIFKVKEHVKGTMLNSNIKKIKGIEFDIMLRNNPVSVEIEDESKISDDYMVVKKQPDKKLIKEAINSGVVLEGVKLIQSTSLQIK